MSNFDDYADNFETIRMTRNDGVLEMHFHTHGGPLVWNLTAHREFEQAFLDVGRDRENDVVIMTGTGDAFSGPSIAPGMHQNRNSMTPTIYDPIYWEAKHLLINLLNIEAPVISIINGPAVRHAELPLLGDIVLASDTATIQDTAHFQGGMVPGDGMHLIMPLLMGRARGHYFLLTGQSISASEALEMGLVNEVLPPAELLPRARELARSMLKQPRLVRRYTRTCLNQELKSRLHDVLGYGLALEGIARMKEPAV
ncbi:enoyl-CoA hydratase/isomerase family protein [Caballeronia zhejiangensis]|uniref:enoyl-CoA hydratase/isomerase family protein n=1 Tax=Caballeronia zhejiangensis TaxID=871203 RepID=UPI001FD3D806|nr:enoyl-CoA hydratase/isomerase family protein [Caballeronia zhejiangensis]